MYSWLSLASQALEHTQIPKHCGLAKNSGGMWEFTSVCVCVCVCYTFCVSSLTHPPALKTKANQPLGALVTLCPRRDLCTKTALKRGSNHGHRAEWACVSGYAHHARLVRDMRWSAWAGHVLNMCQARKQACDGARGQVCLPCARHVRAVGGKKCRWQKAARNGCVLPLPLAPKGS